MVGGWSVVLMKWAVSGQWLVSGWSVGGQPGGGMHSLVDKLYNYYMSLNEIDC